MPTDLPQVFQKFTSKHPDIWQAQEDGAAAVEAAGPLDRRQRELIKIGICLGANLQTALRRHVQQAHEHGASREEIEQAVLLGTNTVGFPAMMMAWSAAMAQLEEALNR